MKTKVLILFGMALVFSTSGNAQVSECLFAEINIARYAKTQGLFPSDYYENEPSFINGFELGYQIFKKLNYYLGIRKLQTLLKPDPGFAHEETEINGMEYSIGFEYVPNNHKRFHLSYSFEFFGEFSKQIGTYWVDYPPTYEVNHQKRYYGIAPELKLNFKIISQLKVVTSSRVRMGFVQLNGIKSTQSRKILYKRKPGQDHAGQEELLLNLKV